MTTAILILVALVLALLLVLVLRRPAGGAEVPLLQQQLVEVRGRLDVLAAAQQDLPRALADGRAAQALADGEQLFIGAVSDRQFVTLCEVLQCPELAAEPKIRRGCGQSNRNPLHRSMERETGFEPATPTLARLCSTN